MLAKIEFINKKNNGVAQLHLIVHTIHNTSANTLSEMHLHHPFQKPAQVIIAID
jgi:hypothetical protein